MTEIPDKEARGLPPGIRKLIGLVTLLVLLVVYTIGAVAIAIAWVNAHGPLAQIPYYVIAGCLWVVPAHYLLRWMTKGDKPAVRRP
jgi:hypothetical protein